jgi:uncharacterized protein (DUF342 family)
MAVTTQPADLASNRQGETPRIAVAVAPTKLTATVRLSRPEEGQSVITADAIREALSSKGITFGVDTAAIESLAAQPRFDEEVVIARGQDPVTGKDARLIIKIKTVQDFTPKEDADGRIDYKDLDFVQNAVKGQVLAEKIPAAAGVAGIDVFGKPVSARNGSDIRLPAGANTVSSEDGLKLMAGTDGSISYANRQISIHELHIVGGDVCIQTGNIKHTGSLVIQGKVETGFEVFARGNIEIGKNVDDAKVVCQGNILVKGGVLGSRKGMLKADGDIHCKYVDDQMIIAGNDLYVGGELYNSVVTAKNRIIVTGSKGRIVGGKIMAGNEIRSTCLGSDAGTRTELHVGFDVELMKKYHDLTGEIKVLKDNAERVKDGLYTLYRLQLNQKLTPEQLDTLKKLEDFKNNLPAHEQELLAAKKTLEEEIQRNHSARIIAEKRVYPGVILYFGIIYKEITDIMGPSYFQITGSTITWEEYKPSRHDARA